MISIAHKLVPSRIAGEILRTQRPNTGPSSTDLDQVWLTVQRTGMPASAKCPAHDDARNSLSIFKMNNGETGFKCHAGCDLYEIYEELNWLTTYTYHNQRGRELFQIVRVDFPDGSKSIKPRHKDPSGDYRIGLSGIKPTLYNLPKVLKPENTYIVICEGEKCAVSLKRFGYIATTNPFGAGRWKDEYSLLLAGKRVAIFADNDDAGRKHAEAVAQSVFPHARNIKVIHLPSLPEKGDIADFIEQGATYDDVNDLIGEAPYWYPNRSQSDQANQPQGDAVISALCLEDVEVLPVEWIWKGLIPKGALTTVDGDPGTRKTLIMIDAISRLTTGRGMPLEFASEAGPMACLILTAEDDIARTIKPRLLAAGGNPSLVHCMAEIKGEKAGEMRPVRFPDDLSRLEAFITAKNIKFVVVDTLMAHISGKLDSYKDQDVRQAMTPLARLAERTGAAIVLIRHLNKSQGVSAIYRGGGSVGITGAARSVILAAKNPANPAEGVLAVIKCNLSRILESLVFSVEECPVNKAPKIRWLRSEWLDPDRLVAAPQTRSAGRIAEQFIRDFLSNGPVRSTELTQAAEEAGILSATLKRARKRLHLDKFVRNSHWYVSLPEIDEE